MINRCQITKVYFIAFILTFCSSQATAVDIIVKEHFGIERHRYPAGLEVPFVKGALKNPASLILLNPHGEPVPFQADTVAKWEDDSVQRLRVSFLVDIAAEGSAVYKLTESHEAKSPHMPGLLTVEKPDLYQVTGDGLQLDVSKKLDGLLSSVQIAQTEFVRPCEARLTVRKGMLEVEAETKDSVVKLESAGELRATFTWEGDVKYLMASKTETGLAGLFKPKPETIRTRVRLERLAGQPWVRLTYSFARSLQDVWVRVKHRFDLGTGPLRYELCGYTKFSGSLGLDESVTLARDEAMRPWPMPLWAITSGADYSPDKLLLRGFVPPGRIDKKMETAGWGVISSKQRTIIVTIHDFWRGGHKRISLFGDGTVVIGIYLRPTFNLPVLNTEQDRWATTTFTYAFLARPLEQTEAAARALTAGLEIRCPNDYYLSCGSRPPKSE